MEERSYPERLLYGIRLGAWVAGLALVALDWLFFPLIGLGQSWWRLVGVIVGCLLIVFAAWLERHFFKLRAATSKASQGQAE